jgi:hypothetical protein
MSNKTRSAALGNINVKDIQDIPTIELKNTQDFPRKYFRIDENIHAYVFRSVMTLE